MAYLNNLDGLAHRAPAEACSSPAAVVDAQATQTVELASVWCGLVSGALKIQEAFFTATRCGLVLTRQHQRSALPIEGRSLVVVELMLCGVGQNRIAIELGLAASTVALLARAALERLGAGGRPSRAHPTLMLAATVARHPELRVLGSESLLLSEHGERRVIGMPRPDLALHGVAPRAELEVVRQLVQGRCYQEISDERGTSARTIANQLGTAFRRLSASGRNELVQRLFVVSGALPPSFRPLYREASILRTPQRSPDALLERKGLKESGVHPSLDFEAHEPATGRVG